MKSWRCLASQPLHISALEKSVRMSAFSDHGRSLEVFLSRHKTSAESAARLVAKGIADRWLHGDHTVRTLFLVKFKLYCILNSKRGIKPLGCDDFYILGFSSLAWLGVDLLGLVKRDQQDLGCCLRSLRFLRRRKKVKWLLKSTLGRLSSNNRDFCLYFYPLSERIRGFTNTSNPSSPRLVRFYPLAVILTKSWPIREEIVKSHFDKININLL